jgi:hypothetical protein
LGVAGGHPQRGGPATLSAFLNLILIFLKKNKYFYLFINKFFFIIKMDTCRHLIGDTCR